MDICFHYFAVKTVAKAAGYHEEQAQRIATYSQLMDDYDWQGYLRAENMPDYLKRDEADVVYNEKLKIISPVATGFPSVIDMAELILPRSQKLIVSPFHFIPQNERRVSNGDLRTVPAKLHDGSYISSMLDRLEADMASSSISESDALMKMGMLLHTFADTYAHQLFTGYNNRTNSVKLISAKDNITQDDATKEYGYWIEQWISQIEEAAGAEIPTIGHMSLVSIPDLSHLSFEMEYIDIDGIKHVHSRSNTDLFVAACKELYLFMRGVTGKTAEAEIEWETLAPLLAKGFLVDTVKDKASGKDAVIGKLSEHWSGVFKNYRYTYDYSSKAITDSFKLTKTDSIPATNVLSENDMAALGEENLMLFGGEYSDDFYKFTLFADEHLINLYGDHPRKLLAASNSVPYDNIKVLNDQ